MTPQPPPVPMPSPLSAATLGKVRRMLVARLSPEVLNPFDRTPEREQLVRSTIAAILEDPELELAPVPALVAAVEAAVCGLGPLQPLVDDPEVADILVNAPDAIFVERAGRLEPAGVRLASDAELIEIAERIAALAGRELSVAHPIVDARMPDGSRVNAVIPPVGGPYLSIRKFNRLRLDLVPGGRHGRDWVTEGGMNAEMADFLGRLVRAKANFLVAGETGAGKTTFLRSLTDLFDPTERVGVVEDTAELALENPNRFNLETIHPHDLASRRGREPPARRRRPRGQRPADAARPADRRRDPPAEGGLLHAPGAPHRARRLGHHDPRQLGRGRAVPARAARPPVDARPDGDRPADLHRAGVRPRRRPAPAALGRRIVRQIAALDGLDRRRLPPGRRLPRRPRRGSRRGALRPRSLVAAVGAAAGTSRGGGRAMDLTLVGAVATGIAVFSGLMAIVSGGASTEPTLGERLRAWREERIAGARKQLAQARLDLRPETYLAVSIVAPLVLGMVGLLLSVPMAILGLVVGAFVPRWYVRYLVGGEARAASDDAPRVLRAMVNRAAAGGTYPDLFAAAAEGARHRWVKADFEEILGRYYANEPPADALVEVRRRQAGRNLALVYDALITLTRTHQPASAAAEVLGSLGEAARSNQSIARQAAPRAGACGSRPRSWRSSSRRCSCTSRSRTASSSRR